MSKATSTTDKPVPTRPCPDWCDGDIHRDLVEPDDVTTHNRSVYTGPDPAGEYIDVRIESAHTLEQRSDGEGYWVETRQPTVTLWRDNLGDGAAEITMSAALARSIAAALTRAADLVESS